MSDTPERNDDEQIERADEEAARAAAAAEEAVEAASTAADEAATVDAAAVAEEAADEAAQAAEQAAGAAEAAAEAPKPKRARKAREAEVAADQAEEAADEAKDAAAKPKRTGKPKAEEAPAKPAPARKRDQRRPVEAGVEVSAHAKYVRTSARKARLVCDHIRGKDVEQARAILAFTPRAAAKDWAKLLESAVANAEHNHELVGEELKIAAVYADEGPTLKRYRPRAMGRATRIRKRTSHLTITLTPKEL
jgi:ribosomal protein L22